MALLMLRQIIASSSLALGFLFVSIEFIYAAPLLLWSSLEYNGFYTANIDGTNVTPVIEGTGSNSTGIAYDPISGRVYWGDIYGAIQSSNIDGSDYQFFLAPQTSFVWNMAVYKGYLYFNCADHPDGTSGLNRVKLDGSGLVQIGSDGAGEAIAIDHRNGQVYYQVSNHFQYSSEEQVVDAQGLIPPTSLPNQLAGTSLIRGMFVDEVTNHLYYVVDRGGIWRSNLDGSNQTFVGNPSNESEYSVFVDAVNDTIYWSTLEGTVGRMDLDGRNVATLYSSDVYIWSLTLYNPVPEPAGLAFLAAGQFIFILPRRKAFRVLPRVMRP
jgi:hypothetical protein